MVLSIPTCLPCFHSRFQHHKSSLILVFVLLQGQLAVDCCLQLINELSAASTDTPVLLAVDDYNALYWQTEYGTTVHKAPRGKPAYQYRKEVKVNKLNLVSLRVSVLSVVDLLIQEAAYTAPAWHPYMFLCAR